MDPTANACKGVRLLSLTFLVVFSISLCHPLLSQLSESSLPDPIGMPLVVEDGGGFLVFGQVIQAIGGGGAQLIQKGRQLALVPAVEARVHMGESDVIVPQGADALVVLDPAGAAGHLHHRRQEDLPLVGVVVVLPKKFLEIQVGHTILEGHVQGVGVLLARHEAVQQFPLQKWR